MPKISVITPTNSLEWYASAKKSLLRQTLVDWEWIVLFNGGAFVESDDPRIKCIPTQFGSANVGALKREACMYASADYIVEFDHDDELSRDCLEEVLAAFETTGAAFVYSDDAHVMPSGQPQPPYRQDYGWIRQAAKFHGETEETVLANVRPELLPQNISRIWFAPDHVRAWRKDAYIIAGGHKADLKICDDLDLMINLYATSRGKFHRIPKCLYKYNVHGGNTWLQNQEEITRTMWRLHDNSIHRLCWAHWIEAGKRCIDLGGGMYSPKGWESVDTQGAQITADLNGDWPFEDNSVGAFRANDTIEHLRNPIHTMNEAHRSLVHGGLFLIEVPSTDGRGAFADPTHVSFWNEASFSYYTNSEQAQYIKHAGLKCRFQVVRLVTLFPTEWHRAKNFSYVRAHLAAIKDGPRLHGKYDI